MPISIKDTSGNTVAMTNAQKTQFLSDLGAISTSAASVLGLSLLGAADAAAGRTALGLGTAATSAASAFATSAQGLKADSALQSIPIASASVLGGVKIGTGLAVAGDGTISVSGGGGGSIAVSNQGTQITAAATSINFVGGAISATNNAGAVTVTVTTGGYNAAISGAVTAAAADHLKTIPASAAATVTLSASGLPSTWEATYLSTGAFQITFATADTAVIRNAYGHTKSSGTAYEVCTVTRISATDFLLHGATAN